MYVSQWSITLLSVPPPHAGGGVKMKIVTCGCSKHRKTLLGNEIPSTH